MAKSRETVEKKNGAVQTVLSLLIPIALVGIAVFQAVNNQAVDKYIIGALLVIALGAAGWRVDTLIESWLEYRTGGPAQKQNEE